MVNKILEPVLIRSIELHMIIQTVILQLLERKGCSSLSQSVEKDLAVCPIRVCVQLKHPYPGFVQGITQWCVRTVDGHAFEESRRVTYNPRA